MNTSWLDTNEYPFQPHYYSVNGHNLHYIDEGHGEVILFVHGTPSWSFDFRNIIQSLRNHYRCIAIDHIGFGLSDKPYHYDYTSQNHSRTLEQFIHEKNLTDITLIVHDFGGPIGLSCALRQSDRIKNIVVLNSWLWSSKNEPDFIKFSAILKNPLLPFLYRYLNFSPRFLLPASFGIHKPSKKVVKHYAKPFENSKQREGTVAFARSLSNDQDWFEELWNKKETISHKPILFIWGMKDSFIKPHYLEKFRSGFPNSTYVQLQHAGHFPHEEEPGIVSESIRGFLEMNT